MGNFEIGYSDIKIIYELSHTQNLLVIASGRCYIINPEEPVPISVFGYSVEKVFEVSDGRLVLQDGTNLIIVEQNGEYLKTEQISWDGLRDLELVGSVVSGFSWEPDRWIDFTYDIDTKVLIGGGYNLFLEKQRKPGGNSGNY